MREEEEEGGGGKRREVVVHMHTHTHTYTPATCKALLICSGRSPRAFLTRPCISRASLIHFRSQ